MNATLYAFNRLCLSVFIAGTVLLTLSTAFKILASLPDLGLLPMRVAIIAVLLLFFKYLAYLWKENREFAQNKPAKGWVARDIPLLAILLLAGYGIMHKMSALVRPSNVKASIGNLGAIRNALSIYYGDLEGQYPEDLTHLTIGGKYLLTLPKVMTLDHPDSNEVTLFPSMAPMDSGTWGYVNNPYDQQYYGSLFIDCTHTDSRGSVWTGY